MFEGWKEMEGNEVLINAPKTVQAEWRVERKTKWLPIVIIIVTIPSTILIAVITRKIRKHSVKMRRRSYWERMYFCPYCGKPVLHWAKFCSNCGRKLTEEVVEEEI